jgi:hypothetical protein
MKLTRIKQLRKELKAERLDLVEIAEIERAFNRIPQKNLRDLKENATAGDMLDELEARAKKPKSKAKAERWAKIEDYDVRLVFKCDTDEDCDNEEVVSPDSMDNGTPICPLCDNDMTYSHTEINTNR